MEQTTLTSMYKTTIISPAHEFCGSGTRRARRDGLPFIHNVWGVSQEDLELGCPRIRRLESSEWVGEDRTTHQSSYVWLFPVGSFLTPWQAWQAQASYVGLGLYAQVFPLVWGKNCNSFYGLAFVQQQKNTHPSQAPFVPTIFSNCAFYCVI